MMNAKVHDALIVDGTPDEKARAAASVSHDMLIQPLMRLKRLTEILEIYQNNIDFIKNNKHYLKLLRNSIKESTLHRITQTRHEMKLLKAHIDKIQDFIDKGIVVNIIHLD